MSALDARAVKHGLYGRHRYPFAPEDEGVVFGRCEWLERVAWDLAYGDIGKRHAARRDYMANVR